MKIKLLSEDTIQKIAAGEVVERPASIVKELVENSIDANADEITVEIKNGGKSFIKVTDNGTGIEKEDAEHAFLRHATSKIKDFEDLYKTYTMGFRGEALASIVAVSSLNIYTKTKDEKAGIHLYYDNNKLVSKKSIGMNVGTIIEVTNLFEYLPVRKKFLSSDISETNRISSLMYSFAISNTGVSINYYKDDRLIFSTNKDNSLKDNLRILFTNDYTDNILEINTKSDEYELFGYISNSKYYKGNRSMQYIFVNGRYIDHPELINQIETQYYSIIPSGRFPAFQIFINTDPKNIDINISPNKQKINFNFSDELFDLIKNTIQDGLLESQNAKEIKYKENEDYKPNFYDLNSDDSYKKILDAYKEPQNLVDETFAINDLEDDFNSDGIDIIDIDDSEEYNSYNENTILQGSVLDPVIQENQLQFDTIEAEHSLDFIGNIFGKYLVFEDKLKNELLIVNQNAAHQRLIYEEFEQRYMNQNLKVSDLISPIIIELSLEDMQKYEQNREVFKSFAFEIDQFGSDSLAIRSLPFIGDMMADKNTFLSLLDSITSTKLTNEDLESFKRKAVAQSIVKTKVLTKEEAFDLLKRLGQATNPYQTQAGRKIQYTLSQVEFERIIKL